MLKYEVGNNEENHMNGYTIFFVTQKLKLIAAPSFSGIYILTGAWQYIKILLSSHIPGSIIKKIFYPHMFQAV